MKSKTEAGETRPEPTKKDCDQFDRTIDLVLLFEQYEADEHLLARAEETVIGLRAIAKRCNALLEGAEDDEDE